MTLSFLVNAYCCAFGLQANQSCHSDYAVMCGLR